MLITYLSMSEILYIVFLICSISYPTAVSILILRNIFSLMVCFWTNVISFVVFYVVTFLKVFETAKNILAVFVIVSVPSVVVALLTQLLEPTNTSWKNPSYFTYYLLQISSMVLNIIFYISVMVLLNRRSSAADEDARNNDPVRLLVERLRLYAMVQVACRVPVLWYSPLVGQFNSSLFDLSSQDNFEKASTIICAATIPSSGIGFFLIYLKYTPGAYLLLRNTFFEACYLLRIKARPDGDFAEDTLRKSVKKRKLASKDASVASSTRGYRCTFDAYRPGDDDNAHAVVPFHTSENVFSENRQSSASDDTELSRANSGRDSELGSRPLSDRSSQGSVRSSLANTGFDHDDPYTVSALNMNVQQQHAQWQNHSNVDDRFSASAEDDISPVVGSGSFVAASSSAVDEGGVYRTSIVEMGTRSSFGIVPIHQVPVSPAPTIDQSMQRVDPSSDGFDDDLSRSQSTFRQSELDGVVDYSELDEQGLQQAIERMYRTAANTSKS